ncbi:MAG TPA: proteasome accessory factor PafA2 family protein, partial [Chthoniobacteraceae bacterium]|nr:proteasome accessory factor PafA2 family protein [Chthoniobacteraceae bacterium]
EDKNLPHDVMLRDAVAATREISREGTGLGRVELEDGRTRGTLDIQYEFLEHIKKYFARRDEETDWVLESWAFTLDALREKPELLIGGVDWISKKWLLDTFRESEGLEWQDPWLQSLDLEYHSIDPGRSLFHALKPAKQIGEFNDSVRRPDAMRTPPSNTRAHGRGNAVAYFQQHQLPYVINWDSIALENQNYLMMPDPFKDYDAEVSGFLA